MPTAEYGRKRLESLYRISIEISRRGIRHLESLSITATSAVPERLYSVAIDLSKIHAEIDHSERKASEYSNEGLLRRILNSDAHLWNAVGLAARQVAGFHRRLDDYWNSLPLWKKLLPLMLGGRMPPSTSISERDLSPQIQRHLKDLEELHEPAKEAFNLTGSGYSVA